MKVLDTWFNIIIQLAVGLVAVVLALASAFGWPASAPDRTLLLWVLGVLGVLCIAVGFERWRVFGDIKAQIEQVSNEIRSSRSVQLLEGERQISRHSLSMALTCEDNLVSFLIGTDKSQPEWWFDAVIAHFKRLKNIGHAPTWTVYVLHDFNADPPDFGGRYQKLQKAGLLQQVSLKRVDFKAPAGYEFFIVDDRHVYLDLPMVTADDQSTVRALFLYDDQRVAAQLRNWAASLESESVGLGPTS